MRGFEAEAQATLPGGIALDIAAQVAEGRALDDNAYLDDISPVNIDGHRAPQAIRRARRSGSCARRTSRDDDHFGPTERAVPGYTLVDAAAGYQVAKPLELRVQARNLLDETHFASQDVRAVFAPGRSVSLVATVKF